MCDCRTQTTCGGMTALSLHKNSLQTNGKWQMPQNECKRMYVSNSVRQLIHSAREKVRQPHKQVSVTKYICFQCNVMLSYACTQHCTQLSVIAWDWESRKKVHSTRVPLNRLLVVNLFINCKMNYSNNTKCNLRAGIHRRHLGLHYTGKWRTVAHKDTSEATVRF